MQSSQDSEWEDTSEEAALIITEGSEFPLKGKAVYFLNATPENKEISMDAVSERHARRVRAHSSAARRVAVSRWSSH